MQWLITALAFLGMSFLFSGVHVDGFWVALGVAILLSLVRFVTWPLRMMLELCTLPLNIITMGLPMLIVYGLLIWVVDAMVVGFWLANFWWALLCALILAAINSWRRSS